MKTRLSRLRYPVGLGEPKIYTTGAFVSPTRIVVDGREVWLWVVEEFDGDSFLDGDICCPIESAKKPEYLVHD